MRRLAAALLTAVTLLGIAPRGAEAAGPPFVVLVGGLRPTAGRATVPDNGTFNDLIGSSVWPASLKHNFFSYAGQGWTGVPLAYSASDAEQPLAASVQRLQVMVRRLKAQGLDVRVVGFSLGGLVATTEAAWAVTTDPPSLPSAVLAIDAPLNGRNLAAACRSSIIDMLCPSGPIAGDLAGIYADANWRTARDAALQRGQALYGLRVGVQANSNDCIYDTLRCPSLSSVSEVDDRWVQMIPSVTPGKIYAEPLGLGSLWVTGTHSAILHDPLAMADAAAWLAS